MSDGNKVFAGFKKSLSKVIDYHDELTLAVYMKKRQASLESILVEQLALTVAVMWEAFVNDLLLTYVAENPNTYLANLESKIDKSISYKFGSAIAKSVIFSRPTHLDRRKALAMIDPEGWNITARSAEALSNKANELLNARYAKKFFLDSEDREFIDILLHLRNYLSHRSEKARRLLKTAISVISNTSRNSFLSGPFVTAGSYLKQHRGAGETRAKFIVNRVIKIAEKLS